MLHSRRNAAPVGTKTTTHSKPSMMQRLRGRKANTVTTTKHSTNPLTGTETTTRTEKRTGDHHHHRGTRSSRRSHRHTAAGTTAGTTTTTTGATHHHHHHHQRRPSIGDKISGGMMKLRGSLTRRPGLKAAGTRRMHGTDGRGARY